MNLSSIPLVDIGVVERIYRSVFHLLYYTYYDLKQNN